MALPQVQLGYVDSTGTTQNVTGTPSGALLISEDIGTATSASNTAAAASSCTASLAAVAGKTNYLASAIITTGQATVAAVSTVTITGTAGGTLTFQMPQSTTQGGQLILFFPTPLVGSAVNTAITCTVPATTNGGIVAVALTGYYG